MGNEIWQDCGCGSNWLTMARLWLWEASKYKTTAGSLLANYIVPLVSGKAMTSLQRPQLGRARHQDDQDSCYKLAVRNTF